MPTKEKVATAYINNAWNVYPCMHQNNLVSYLRASNDS